MNPRFTAAGYGIVTRLIASTLAWGIYGLILLLLKLPDQVIARIFGVAARWVPATEEVNQLAELEAIFSDPERSALICRGILTRGNRTEYVALIRGAILTGVFG